MRIKRWIVLGLLFAVCLAPACAEGSLANKIKSAKERTYSQTAKKGDSDENVLKIKKRLQELGYYRADASLSEAYNDAMAERVKLFQENNGLEVTGEADSTTLRWLKASYATPGEWFEGSWNEPDVSLMITKNAQGQWKKKGNDQFSFCIQVKNISTSRTIVAAEFYVYTEDAWGNELISVYDPYVYALEDVIKPGEKKYTSDMEIPYRADTFRVYIAIGRVKYSDGTYKSLPGNDFEYWTIQW